MGLTGIAPSDLPGIELVAVTTAAGGGVHVQVRGSVLSFQQRVPSLRHLGERLKPLQTSAPVLIQGAAAELLYSRRN
jgi:hypothetical protein